MHNLCFVYQRLACAGLILLIRI